ncbi:SGNH/GDSL hydrolase family protein [Methylobacterium iners]|uniref:SGNH hydrolase-type esterase domain-containing protein n=1 Tax=Methylobacterium iners TaxID=418707 RepID=A0ABQ4S5G9_9HYPH|nr:GDSL-type esterase/lipase family protein [Methylobacterium iners]GJD97053.1 hypothetical protein OCOJLMKI_4281 [Methylobacterium iners]
MRHRLLLGLVGMALAAAGFALGAWRTPSRLDARLYAQNRLIAVQVHLDEAPAEYILLAGDSQAELHSPAQRACGLEIVNGGVSGSSSAVYAELLERLALRTRPRAVALTIGTNDLLVKNDPRGAAAATRFEASLTRIVTRLRAVSDRVVVTAVPPIGRVLAGRLDPLAVTDYSARIRVLCERLGCHYADPFADLRDGETGFAREGAMRDGLHLAAYRPALRALEPALCPVAAAEGGAGSR